MGHLISDKHFFVKASSGLKEMSQVLKGFDVSIFTYMRRFHEGGEIYFSSNESWVKDYYNEGLYHSSSFKEYNGFEKKERIIWPLESEAPVFLHAKKCFNSHYGITLLQKSTAYTEFYFFSTTSNNLKALNYFINNFDIFERFILVFKEKFSHVLQSASLHKLILPGLGKEGFFDLSALYAEKKKAFMQSCQFKVYTIENGPLTKVTLSLREMECALCLLRGMSAKATGEKLFLSSRTVEVYLARLKDKFDCRLKSELVKLLLQTDLCQYI